MRWCLERDIRVQAAAACKNGSAADTAGAGEQCCHNISPQCWQRWWCGQAEPYEASDAAGCRAYGELVSQAAAAAAVVGRSAATAGPARL